MNSVLLDAAKKGDLATVQALLDKDVYVNAKDDFRGQTALMWAALRWTAGGIHLEIIKLLKEAGAKE